MKRKKKILSVVLGMVMAVLLLPATVLAAGSVDTGKNCHLTISYQDGEKALVGAPFDIYRVAAVEETGELTPAAPFEQYNVDIRGKNDSAWKTLASTLEGYVLRDRITPYDSGETDGKGILTFPQEKEKLETGLYLVLGRRHVQDGRIYDTEPFMVLLPTLDEENNDWLYDMTVNPKHESVPVPPPMVDREVLKIWDDEGYEENRPKEITVQLLRNGEVYDTVTLNADNNWRYKWENLDGEATWTIVEKEMEGYEVTVTRDGITFVIRNTFVEPPVTPSVTPPVTPSVTPPVTPSVTPPVTPSVKPPVEPPTEPSNPNTPGNPNPPDTDPPEIVQTGQLWWPVPMLLAGGLLLIILGLLRRRGNRDEV